MKPEGIEDFIKLKNSFPIKIIAKLLGVILIFVGFSLEMAWVGFLFSTVLGIVLILIFKPKWLFAPLLLTTLGLLLVTL